MIKKTSLAIILWCIVLIIATGCMSDFKSRTIIIPEDQFANDTDEGSGEFQVNKIYKLNKQRMSYILGWVDNEHVLGADLTALYEKKGEKLSLEKVDYHNQSRQLLSKLERFTTIGDLSPDGSWVSFITQEEGGQRIKLINVQSLQEIVIEEPLSGPHGTDLLCWSNNSRYISYVKLDSKNKSKSIVVYDVTQSRKSEYALLNREDDEIIFRAKISDNGKHALIVKYRTKEVYSDIELGSLTTNSFASVFEHTLGGGSGNFDFMNDDQIAFIGQDSELILFDQRNESSTTLLEQIDRFALSRDRKSIVYSKKWDTIYAAGIQGNRVMNAKPIYKGVIVFSSQMRWSPDNRKILISGRELYDITPYIEPYSGLSAESVPIAKEMNNYPLIIEIK